ncbi:hypothetical protein [Chondrinema litorale]|uniref:hypothetical protein n=1 Tax=Chondrinema litorale TaxID=2994555 RepID=UPI0025431923|nr:hypothetical protein [Chondrinema litorale]UZR92572.1 hypothetical protein OQ292_11940 [Chondrinema litorale]
MIYYLLILGVTGFVAATCMFLIFKKSAVPNPEELDSYLKAAASGKISSKELEGFQVYLNKRAAS